MWRIQATGFEITLRKYEAMYFYSLVARKSPPNTAERMGSARIKMNF